MSLSLPTFNRPCLIVIGNFDGVHLGHQALLLQARQLADAEKLPLVAVTFEPHPRAYFHPDNAPARLTLPALKAFLLKQARADAVISLPFQAELATMLATDFIDYLTEKLQARRMIVSPHFRFGQGGSGTMALLQEKLGDRVSLFDLIVKDGQPISSTRIREAIKTGQMDLAAQLLGRPHIIYGAKTPFQLLPPMGNYPGWASSDTNWQYSELIIGNNGINSPLEGLFFAIGGQKPPIFSLNEAILADIVSK